MPIDTFHRRLAIVWTFVLALSCLLPPSNFEVFRLDQLFKFDKLLHFISFALLALWWCIALFSQNGASLFNKLLIISGVSLYGLLIEVLQSGMHQGRHFEWGDVIADTSGALIGVLMVVPYTGILSALKKYLPFLK